MSAKPILYSLEFSPPARSVWLTAKYIGLDLDIRNVDLYKQEHLTEKYLKMNPQHTVPTLDDNGIHLWESGPICVYLIRKYGPGNGCLIYPDDVEQRARIDQRMYFNATNLFPLQRNCSIAVFNEGKAELDSQLLADVAREFELLDRFLATDAYLVGNTWTLADLVTATTVSNIQKWAPQEVGQFPRVAKWLERLATEIPGYEELNAKPANAYGEFFHEFLRNNKRAE